MFYTAIDQCSVWTYWPGFVWELREQKRNTHPKTRLKCFPSGKHTKSHWTWPFSSWIYPLKMVIFHHSFLYVYQRVRWRILVVRFHDAESTSAENAWHIWNRRKCELGRLGWARQIRRESVQYLDSALVFALWLPGWWLTYPSEKYEGQ